MDQRDASDLGCSIASAAEVVGERWNLLIMRDAFYGVRRFADFHAHLGIARNILSSRLKWLVAHGVMERHLYRSRPDRHEYVLTTKGHDFFPVLAALMQWGDTWAANGTGPPRSLSHGDCGQDGIHAVASCSACGGMLDADSVRVDPLPEPIRDRVSSSLERWRSEMSDLPTT